MKKKKEVLPKAVNELVPETVDVNDFVKTVSEKLIKDHSIDGLAIAVIKDGAYAPFVIAKSVPDILTLKFVIDREVSNIIERIIKPMA
jgi:hypothetical protein